jgi:hypothetical protein
VLKSRPAVAWVGWLAGSHRCWDWSGRDPDGGRPADGGRGPLGGGRGLLVDRVLDDLLRDDLRVSRDGWSGGQKDGPDELLWPYCDEFHQEVDEVFAAL